MIPPQRNNLQPCGLLHDRSTTAPLRHAAGITGITGCFALVMYKGHWAPETYNRCKTVLSGVYLLGIENKKVTVNPARLPERQTPTDERARYLSPAEEQALRITIRTDWPEHEFELDIALQYRNAPQ
ncbi:MAG TPA: hypothetical protein VG206_00255 [Terriglobia bacterium]|nr:hypothetical protein [Terriglobia bacterium]